MTEKVRILAAVAAWNEAAHQLGIRVVAPFKISAGPASAVCIAFLPDFGGNCGMVIGTAEPPAFETEPALVECARALGMSYSFLNPEKYSTFDAEVFKEALKDWGYFGSPEHRPAWVTTTTMPRRT